MLGIYLSPSDVADILPTIRTTKSWACLGSGVGKICSRATWSPSRAESRRIPAMKIREKKQAREGSACTDAKLAALRFRVPPVEREAAVGSCAVGEEASVSLFYSWNIYVSYPGCRVVWYMPFLPFVSANAPSLLPKMVSSTHF